MKLTDEGIVFLDQDNVHQKSVQDYYNPVFKDFESYLRTNAFQKNLKNFFFESSFSSIC